MDDQVINELTNLVTSQPDPPQGYSYKDVVITLDQEQDSCVLMERQYQNRNKRLFYASGLAIICGMVALIRHSTGYGTLRGASMIIPSRYGHREYLEMAVTIPASDLPGVLHALGEMKATTTTTASEIDFICHEMDIVTNEPLCSFSIKGQDALKRMQREIIPLFSEVDLVAMVDTSTVMVEHQQKAPASNTVQVWTGYLYPSQNTQDVWENIIQVIVDACEDSPFVFPRVELLGGSVWRQQENKKEGALYRVGVVLQMPEKDKKWLLDQETTKVDVWWPQVAQHLVDSHTHAPE